MGAARGLGGTGDGRFEPPALLSTAAVFADDGRLHKAVRVNHRVHIIEEIRLFPTGQPILQLLLDHEQAGAEHGGLGLGGDGVGYKPDGGLGGCLPILARPAPCWNLQLQAWGWGAHEDSGMRGPSPLQALCDRHCCASSPQGLVYAASYTAVAQVPFSNCSLYRSCGECVLARDPFCAWSHGACRSTAPHPPAHPQ